MLLNLLFSVSLYAQESKPVADAPGPEHLSVAVDEALQKAINEKRVVGAVIMVARDGQVIYQNALGQADRENKVPMEKDKIFRLASMTKPIVSIAALKLIEQGKLKLDDPVTNYVPWFKPKTADGQTPIITIKQLLTHTSGLKYGFSEDKKGSYSRTRVSDGLDDTGVTLDENMRRIMRAGLDAKPGSGWRYSLSIDVLGRVIEKVTKKDLSEAVAELVTKPLGMKDTAFFASDAKRLVAAYADGSPEPQRMGKNFVLGNSRFSPGRALNKNAYRSGGAGMVGSAADYLRFLEAVRTHSLVLLNQDTFTGVFTDQIQPLRLDNPGHGWGFISSIVIDPGVAKTPAHKGTLEWGGAYGTSWWIDPDAKLSVVIMTNTTFEGMNGQIVNDVRKAIYKNL